MHKPQPVSLFMMISAMFLMAAIAGAARGAEKHIVLLGGDEEYRSEEGLPMLAKILSERHGFKCTVLLSINKQTGEIDPNTKDNEPGLQALASADLCLMLLRHRAWPDEQMKHFVAYHRAGKPLVALRTSTHAFALGANSAYQAYNDFGKQVLGEKWVSHWGHHKFEATRGILETATRNHPILRGVGNIFGDTDVYEAYPPADATVLVRGQVLKGMQPADPPADYQKKRATDKQAQGVNDPMMPVAWMRQAATTNRVFTTTMGSSTDLQSEGLRRLIINACYWALGMEDRIPPCSDVDIVGDYHPSPYGFGGFKKGLRPQQP
jgi:type 1 glutamine amidotransferase